MPVLGPPGGSISQANVPLSPHPHPAPQMGSSSPWTVPGLLSTQQVGSRAWVGQGHVTLGAVRSLTLPVATAGKQPLRIAGCESAPPDLD